MGRRGPLGQPAWLKLVSGNARRDRLGRAEDPRPIPPVPCPAPAYLSALSRAEWERLEPVLRPQGLLREESLAIFAGYCSAIGAAQEAEALLAEAKKPAQRLLWSGLARKCWTQAQRLGAEFGLTPASRARTGVGCTLPRPKPANPFAGLG